MFERFGMKENVDTKVKTRDMSFIGLNGTVISRYLDPITHEYVKGSTRVDTNMVVDTGAVEIVKWIANASPGAAGMFVYMALGSGITAAAHHDVALQTEYTGVHTYVRILAALTAETETSSSTKKIFQGVATFPAFTGGSAVKEFGMFTQLAVGGTMFNRSLFTTARDNENNDLEVTYKCTVAPYTP